MSRVSPVQAGLSRVKQVSPVQAGLSRVKQVSPVIRASPVQANSP